MSMLQRSPGLLAALVVSMLSGGVQAQGVSPEAAPPATDPAADDASRPTDVALEEDSNERAKAHFEVGKSLYDSGRFKEAAEEWEKAYSLSMRSALLYNIYVARRDASDTAKAIDALRRFLETDDVDPQQRINLEARLRSMEAAQQEAEASAASTPQPAESAAEPVAAPPVISDTVVIQPSEGSSRFFGYALLGLGAAMVATGTVTAIMTRGEVSDLEDACEMNVCPADFPLDSRRDSAETLATVTDVLLVGGLVAGGLGVVLLLVEEKDESGMPQASAGCNLGGCFGRLSF